MGTQEYLSADGLQNRFVRPSLSKIDQTTLTSFMRHNAWRITLPHSYAHPQMIYVSKGSARITIAGRTRGVGPNSVVFIPALVPWCIEENRALQGQLLSLVDLPEAPLPTVPVLQRIPNLNQQKELLGLFETLNDPGSTPGRDRMRFAQLIVLSVWCDRTLTIQSHSALDKSEQLAARFTQKVEEVYQNGCNLAEIGASLDITPTHLTRTLKQTCGKTAGDYLNDRIMHEARRRLLDTDQTASQIGTSLGFSSAAYFSRAFATHAGVPPGAYRGEKRAA